MLTAAQGFVGAHCNALVAGRWRKNGDGIIWPGGRDGSQEAFRH